MIPPMSAPNRPDSNSGGENTTSIAAVDSAADRLPPSSGDTSSSVSTSYIRRQLLLVTILLICLGLLTDDDYHHLPSYLAGGDSDDEAAASQPRRHHLAFATALSRHPPSLRVFRVIAEGVFVLFCAAFSLWVWDRKDDVVGNAGNGYSDNDQKGSTSIDENGCSYEPVEERNLGGTGGGIGIGEGVGREAVGELLFAPPPDSVATNAVWRLCSRRRQGRRTKRDRTGRQWERVRDTEEHDDIDDEDIVDSLSKEVTPPNLLEMIEVSTDNGDQSGDVESKPDGDEEDEDEEASSDSDGHSTETPPQIPLPPSPASVLEMALDGTIMTLVALVLFTVSSSDGGRYIDNRRGDDGEATVSWMTFVADIAAPVFPLVLLALSFLVVVSPWKKRKDIWIVVSLTIGAPFYDVTFRDGFIGDILTSIVRPLQDLAFTAFFLPAGFQAWWTRSYGIEEAADFPLERSWLLHTAILPACTLSPLWWRFLQNLRQVYDTKQRWPYLGNALKYFIAAEVAVFGMYNPNLKKNPVWIACFFGATIYQIWWDVFMDWELLEITTSNDGGGWCSYSLRSKRLYRSRFTYYIIFAINFFLRFVGMLTLIPPVYLSRSTGLVVDTYDPDFQVFSGIAIASSEIFRRAIWGLLRVELETMKTSSVTPKGSGSDGGSADPSKNEADATTTFDELGMKPDDDMKPMSILTSEDANKLGFAWPFSSRTNTSRPLPPLSLESFSDMSDLNNAQIIAELCVYAAIFSGVAIVAAAHREVL